MISKDYWRPLKTDGPVCGRMIYDEICEQTGTHHCNPRAERFVRFCSTFLRHYAGPLARSPFILEDWQADQITRPLFGETQWSDDWNRYVRRYRVAYYVVARKAGKSNLAAAFALYLTLGDDEESAAIYSGALDRQQAEKVFDPADRMRELSPELSARLTLNKAIKRLRDSATNSEYRIIAGDAAGELGHAPHGFIMDEVLSQRDRDLWDAMRTAAGTRSQAMFIALTTETNDDASFGARMIDDAERVQENPQSAPHIFSWVRKTDMKADPWDERNWYHANPGLGTFKSLEEMRSMATEAKNNPEQENSFRQLQLNQRVQQVTRWMPMLRWDKCAGILNETDLLGRDCFGGLDLASTTDLASLVWIFPDEDDDDHYDVLVRAWIPEYLVSKLDKATGGLLATWVNDGYLVATEGDVIDYYGDDTGYSINTIQTAPDGLAIHPQIEQDANNFNVLAVGYDQAQATATAQFMQGLDLTIKPIVQGYGLSSALKEIMRVVKAEKYAGLEHPVLRWAADAAEVKRDSQERLMVVRPDRGASKKRIDPLVAMATAVRMSQVYEPEEEEDTTNPFDDVF